MLSKFISVTLTLALFACSKSSELPPKVGALEPWCEPIADILDAGHRAFPDGFRSNITTLQPFNGRLWIGYGDSAVNLGSKAPVEFRWIQDASQPDVQVAEVLAEGQGAPQRSNGDTGEEQIEPFRIIEGHLCQPGVDSIDADEAWTQARDPALLIEGNFFRLEEADSTPIWRKFRSVPGGEHVHDLAWHAGAMWAVGSGADVRAEFSQGEVFRYLWRSEDLGATFSTVLRVRVPVVGGWDTRFKRLLAVGQSLYVFGYTHPFRDGGPRTGSSIVLRDGTIEELSGPIAPLFVNRSYSLTPDEGIAVAVAAGGRTRSFLVRDGSISEIESWGDRRVIDLAPHPESGGFLLLSGSQSSDTGCRVEWFSASQPQELQEVMAHADLQASAIAWYDGALILGTWSGVLLRAAQN